jgi:hypothetical protein
LNFKKVLHNSHSQMLEQSTSVLSQSAVGAAVGGGVGDGVGDGVGAQAMSDEMPSLGITLALVIVISRTSPLEVQPLNTTAVLAPAFQISSPCGGFHVARRTWKKVQEISVCHRTSTYIASSVALESTGVDLHLGTILSTNCTPL